MPLPIDSAAPAELLATQQAFAAYLRDRRAAPCPADVPPRRMAAYRELLFNNVEGGLSACYPVLHETLGEDAWQLLVQDFFTHHRARSPYYRDIPRAFLGWLNTERRPVADEPAFLRELAHYEWVELALSIDETAIPETGIDANGDLMTGRPALNPLAWRLQYRFPVHRIDADHQPAEAPPEPTRIVVVRNRAHQIRFQEINAATWQLLDAMEAAPALHGNELLAQLAVTLGHPDPAAVIAGGAEILRALREQDILLGTRP